mmetsp:Transcript_9111/g.27412  ORF Transcript_9111/g.27412 Transcript_9111/m.27412 type:complete len:556 (+) Transcript_9111:154-1821(+)
MQDVIEALRLRAARGDVRGVAGLIKHNLEQGLSPTPDVWYALICANRARKDAEGALRALKQMHSAGCVPTSRHYAQLYKCLGENGRAREAFEWFETRYKARKNLAACEFNSIIKISAILQDFSVTQAMYRLMLQLQVRPDIGTFRNMLHVTLKLRNADAARGVLSEMQKQGFQPEDDDYKAVLLIGKDQKVLKMTSNILSDMQDDQMKPNSVHYATMMSILLNAGKLDEAFDLLAKLDEEKIQPINAIYASVFGKLVERRRFGKAEEILSEMRRRQIPTQEYQYKHIISHYFRARRLRDAERMLAEMQAQGHKPSLYTWTAFISGYCKAGETEKAISIYKQLCEDGIELDSRCYNLVMTALINRQQYYQAVEVFHEMTAKHVEPTVHEKVTVMRAFRHLRQADNAEAIFSSIRDPSIFCYTELMMVNFMSGRRKEGFEVFDRLKASGLEISEVPFTVVLSHHVKSGDVAQARAIVHEMKSAYNIKPSVVIYNRLIEANIGSQNLEGVLDVLREMREDGVEPNKMTAIHLGPYMSTKGLAMEGFGVKASVVAEEPR